MIIAKHSTIQHGPSHQILRLPSHSISTSVTCAIGPSVKYPTNILFQNHFLESDWISNDKNYSKFIISHTLGFKSSSYIKGFFNNARSAQIPL
jgi:hypothetical protein